MSISVVQFFCIRFPQPARSSVVCCFTYCRAFWNWNDNETEEKPRILADLLYEPPGTFTERRRRNTPLLNLSAPFVLENSKLHVLNVLYIYKYIYVDFWFTPYINVSPFLWWSLFFFFFFMHRWNVSGDRTVQLESVLSELNSPFFLFL